MPFLLFGCINTPVYNFINGRLADESAILKPLSYHLILYVLQHFSRKWQKISDCECLDLIQNEIPVRFLCGAMLDIGVYALSIVRSFMDEKPDEILSQWKPSPTGSDEQATILLKNHSGQMATVALSMHSKQPKRAMISCEKGYIEIMEYPRADKAVIVDAETGEKTEISCGDTSDALLYEMEDMEHAVLTHDTSGLYLNYTKEVMDIMTYLRKEWNMKYPDENWD